MRRGIAAVGLVSIALVHPLDVPDKFDELPYVGVLFVGLIITSLLLAEGMIRTDDLRVWLVAGVVSASGCPHREPWISEVRPRAARSLSGCPDRQRHSKVVSDRSAEIPTLIVRVSCIYGRSPGYYR